MKIAMIGQKGIPSRAGGVEIHVEEIAAGLVEAGVEVDVYCRRSYCAKKQKWYKGIHLIYIPSINTKYLDAIIYTFLATIVALFKKYDVIHYHACGPASLCWIPKLLHKKVICTSHGKDWQREKWNGIGSGYLKFGEKIIAKWSDEVIVLNEPMRDYFWKEYRRRSNVIPNGVETSVIERSNLIKKKYGLEGKDYILYLGRLVPEKGIHYLIQAYQQLDTDKKLILAGGSSHTDDYVKRLELMCSGNPNIIMTGFVEGKLLRELYSNALVYVLPSEVEGMPLSLLEAMSYGVCCLASDIQENIATGQEKIRYFKCANVKSLRNQLKEILKQPVNVIAGEGLEAKSFVEQRYSWKNVIDRTLSLYRRVTNYTHAHDHSGQDIEKCCILGVHIAVTNMEQTVGLLQCNRESWRGEYICVSNAHTTVMAYEDKEYLNIQNSAVLALPDGKPLSVVSKMRGFTSAERVTGPDLMEEMFRNASNGMRHYFYGSTPETLKELKRVLQAEYPELKIAGMYSPPFRELTAEEDQEVIKRINAAKPDIVWVGLGAPKQERWMYQHRKKINAIMVGTGAGFDYLSGQIKRAPKWMQHMGLEWLSRLYQDPKRLWKRYLRTNFSFIFHVALENKTRREKNEDNCS